MLQQYSSPPHETAEQSRRAPKPENNRKSSRFIFPCSSTASASSTHPSPSHPSPAGRSRLPSSSDKASPDENKSGIARDRSSSDEVAADGESSESSSLRRPLLPPASDGAAVGESYAHSTPYQALVHGNPVIQFLFDAHE